MIFYSRVLCGEQNRCLTTSHQTGLITWLSYSHGSKDQLATPRGLEPPTSSVTGWHSTLLNYEAIYKIDFSLNLYVYIILKIYRKIKLLTIKKFWQRRWVPTPLITFLRPNSLANCPLCHHWVRLYIGDGLRCRSPYHPWYQLFSRQCCAPAQLIRHIKWGITPHIFNYDNRTRSFHHSRNRNRKCNPSLHEL